MYKKIFSFTLLLSLSLQGQRNVNPVFVIDQEYPLDFKFVYATLENIRGGNGQKAYNNQDTACALSLSSKKILIGVFDGHGPQGDVVSRLLPALLKDLLNTKGNIFKLHTTVGESVQKYLMNNCAAAYKSGATACFCTLNKLTTHTNISHYSALFYNVGDSRALVLRKGKILFATQDHKPTLPTEVARIEAAGGYVYNGRACYGNMSYALSRSWGDLYASNILSPQAQIYGCGLQNLQWLGMVFTGKERYDSLISGDILVFATDGLWDALTNEEVVEFISKHESTVALSDIAQQLVQKARNGDNKSHFKSKDDITVVIVKLS